MQSVQQFLGSEERIVFPFDYVKPTSLKDLLDGMREAHSEGAMLAGGTDLHVKIRAGEVHPRVVFDISNLAPIRGIVEEGDHLRIGAAVRMTEILMSATLRCKAQSLVAAVRQMSSRQIRNVATLGGNIVTASPAADAVPPLLAADATLVLLGAGGKREVPLAEFLTGPGKTSLGQEEVLVEVVIPTEPPGCRSDFLKVGSRKAQAISIINLAGRIDIGQDGLVSDVRIALGAVAPTVVRAHRAEEALTGRTPNASNLAEAAALAAEECRPISDVRGTESGRKLLVKGWTLRLLETLCATREEATG